MALTVALCCAGNVVEAWAPRLGYVLLSPVSISGPFSISSARSNIIHRKANKSAVCSTDLVWLFGVGFIELWLWRTRRQLGRKIGKTV